MSINDFIDRRRLDDRRRRRPGTNQRVSGELILIPDFDTFILHNPNDNPSRWNLLPNAEPNFFPPYTSFELPIGLMNPWNHADNPNYPPDDGGPFGTLIPTRTPTRTVMGFNLSGVPTAASIIDAKLMLTVAGNNEWDNVDQLTVAGGNENTSIETIECGNKGGNVYMRSAAAQETINIQERIWVTYNFDGAIAPAIPGFRAMSWGADRINFTWLKFVNGLPPFADSYNPHEGRDHPWSVKAWYKWGARQFHLHMPFGRPFVQISPPPGFENYEHLAYQADQYLCAAEGFSDNQVTYNAPMFHLVQDFERIWRSLIEGKQYCTDAEWASLTEWFNPNDPIRVIAYNGAITKGGEVEENQYPRWSRLFNENYDAALGRLKSSVQPFINCGMQISIDALAGAPGPVPGLYISTDQLSAKAQAGWWEFYMWLVGKIGTQNLYCESAPEKRRNLVTGKLDQSPYLGLNVMASEDWSYFPASTAISFHKLSELGPVKYLRCPYWGGGGPKTGRVNRYLSPARYPDLIPYSDTNGEYEGSKGDGEYRINRQRIDLFFGSAFEEIYVARNLRDRFDQEGDPRPEMNRTIPEYMISPMCLQEYPISWAAPGLKRFIDKFRSIQALGEYVNAYKPITTPTLS
jgi:hypothetical protein